MTDGSEMYFHSILSTGLDGSIIIPILQIRKQRSLKDIKKCVYSLLQNFLGFFASSSISSQIWKIPPAGNQFGRKQPDLGFPFYEA